MTAPESQHENERAQEPSPELSVRDEDLEPHEALRYVAKLFKVLAVLILLLMVANVVIGLISHGTAALADLLVGATQMVVFGGLLWAAGDLSLMFIETNHDLRATRILVGRLNSRVQRFEERLDEGGTVAGRRSPVAGEDRG